MGRYVNSATRTAYVSYNYIVQYSILCVYFVHDPYENSICAFHTFFLFDFLQYLRMVITTIWEYRKIEILVVGTTNLATIHHRK